MRRALVLVFASVSVLAACGGSGDGGNTSVIGVWKGTYSPGLSSAPVTLFAIVESGKPALFFDSQGLSYILPQITGSTFSGTGSVSPPFGYFFTGIGLSDTVAVTGSVSSGEMTGKLTYNKQSYDFALTPYVAFTGNPSVKPGLWNVQFVGAPSLGINLNVAVDGTFQGNGPDDCRYSGTATIPQAGVDIIDMGLDPHGTGGLFPTCSTQHPVAVAFESQVDNFGLFGSAAGTYYYVVFYSLLNKTFDDPQVSYVAVMKAP